MQMIDQKVSMHSLNSLSLHAKDNKLFLKDDLLGVFVPKPISLMKTKLLLPTIDREFVANTSELPNLKFHFTFPLNRLRGSQIQGRPKHKF